MDDEADELPRRPDLTAAVRRARLESAERAEAIADVRQIEAARLSLLEGAIRPLIDQTPEDVDLFDLGLAPGERPRLFLDMIAFVEMAHDKRAYRFFQDTRHGRILIAESPKIETIVAAITNYVARRLVERERALAADWRSEAREAAPPPRRPARAAAPPPAPPEPDEIEPPPRRWLERLGDALSFLLMTLGAVTLILGLAVGAYALWTSQLRELWSAWIGPPPF